MLIALRWKHCLIPLYFRVCKASTFLREMKNLQSGAAKRFLARVSATTGLGTIAVLGWNAIRRRGTSFNSEEVPEFDDWADRIWAACHSEFAMIAVRDARSLRTLYPAGNEKLTRIRVSVSGQVVGWAVVGVLHRPGHEQYGDMRVGTILDTLASSEYAPAVIAAGTDALQGRGADLILCNQSHYAWTAALASAGFLCGPSNYIFAAAPHVSRLLDPFTATVSRAHLNRGDGDNLLQYQ
jgi:hypothetical protein